MPKTLRKSKSRRGRKPMEPGKSRASVLTVRMQPAERESIDAAAARDGVAVVSDWVRSILLIAAGHASLGKETEGGGVEPQRRTPQRM